MHPAPRGLGVSPFARKPDCPGPSKEPRIQTRGLRGTVKASWPCEARYGPFVGSWEMSKPPSDPLIFPMSWIDLRTLDRYLPVEGQACTAISSLAWGGLK